MYMKHLVYVILAVGMVLMLTYILMHDEAAAPEVQPTTEVSTEISDTTETPTVPDDIATHIASKADKIVLTTPAPYERISSPVTITGKARGPWCFEASFPVTVVNWDGLIIGEGIATADGDWMTTEFVPFTATVTFTADPDAYSDRGAIILQRDNPSGLPENDDALEVPVIFK